jgi:glycerol-3-phosphate O-acyltransferase
LLGIVIDTVIENKIPDATFIPMTINYEKVFEADTYPLELLGESKVKESFLRVLNATKIMNNNQGRIYIEFGEPISI